MRYEGTLTDIEGIRVGHYTDKEALTGCTAILFDRGAVCGVDVRGAAPGTRETDLLQGFHLVDKVNAIMLTGGSAFGLACADGAMRYLERNGVGFRSDPVVVPIVPAAVIFDLAVGRSDVRPDAAAGEIACENAMFYPVEQGNVGAGTGATIGKLLGGEFAAKGGLGSASICLQGGIIVSALVVVNALGDVYNHRTGKIIAGLNEGGRFLSTMEILCGRAGAPEAAPQAGGNTTIGVIATNAALTREEANRLATLGHDGLALAIRPVHTQFDGDTLFGVSTGEISLEDKSQLLAVFAAATEAAARAAQNAVVPMD